MKNPSEKQIILIVDDVPENITVLNNILSNDYKIKVALNGKKALELASNPAALPDLILLDVMMPSMDGYEVCQRLKSNEMTSKIPVIFVTALDEVTDETNGFEVGAVDYISKPISPSIVRARIKTHLALYDQKRMLEQMVLERTKELVNTQDVTITGLATLVEFRDPDTGAHIQRTRNYIRLLAETLVSHPRFSSALNRDTIELLYKSAPLHDIGKVAVPDHILHKPGKLTSAEFEIMKKHTIYGRDTIVRAEQALGSNVNNSFLHLAREIAYTHHEKWDGSGYPQGLKGDDIPISGRLMAMADIYDALTTERVYKTVIPHSEAVKIIIDERGRHLDPDITDAFLALQDKFQDIVQNITDPA